MQERWEGNVHYYDYTADSIRRCSNRDAFTVAEAWVYSEDEQCCLGIVVLVDSKDLKTKAATLEKAISEGSALRNRLVKEHREEALCLKENQKVLYSWNGRQIG